MMQVLLPIQPCEQEFSWSCVPACAKMALSYIGIEVTEVMLYRLFESIPLVGTPPDTVANLTCLGIRVQYGVFGMQRLERNLDLGNPSIIFLKTSPLPLWQVNEPHAVLLVGTSRGIALVNDPAFGEATQEIALAKFIEARKLADNYAAVLTRQ